VLNPPSSNDDKHRMKKGISIYLVLLTAITCSQCLADSLIGEKSPELKIRGWVTDNPPDLRSLEGKVRVLDFWATWCGPCVANIPHLIKLYDKYKPIGVEFIALSQDKSTDKVRQLVREKGMNCLVAIDDGTVDRFKISSYPTVVVIGHTGKIMWYGLPWDAQFERAIADAAEKASSAQAQNTDIAPPAYLIRTDIIDLNRFYCLCRITDFAFMDACKPQIPYIAFQDILAKNEEFNEMVCKTDGLQKKNPFGIHDIYADFLTGSYLETVGPVNIAYLQISNTQ
jgi:thiol-disulfide isomerase/thioredoxin